MHAWLAVCGTRKETYCKEVKETYCIEVKETYSTWLAVCTNKHMPCAFSKGLFPLYREKIERAFA
jgi:hypothetical protein